MMRWVFIYAAAMFVCGCVKAEPTELLSIEAPSLPAFTQVGRMLLFRCGSLDCHGSAARPFRLRGDKSHRSRWADNSPLGGDTTEEENIENYRSVLGLQPEELLEAILSDAEGSRRERLFAKLFILAKPTNTISHKGGQVFEEGSAGYGCIREWLETAPQQELPPGTAAKCIQAQTGVAPQ